MVSVKQITMSERTKVNEASMKEKVVVINEHSDNEDEVTLEERCGKSNNPKVVHKGKNSDLNFENNIKGELTTAWKENYSEFMISRSLMIMDHWINH